MDRIVSGITEYKKNKYKVCMDDVHTLYYIKVRCAATDYRKGRP